MSVLGCILGWFWNFVKNFFEGHTRPPHRSAFAPPVPLCNEPGYLVYLRNVLCVNLLQYRNTCFCVATSVEISVFGVYFCRSLLCIYYANEFSFLPLFLSCFVLSYLISFTAFSFFSCSFLVLLFILKCRFVT